MPGGALADKLGAKNVMTATLLFSGLCCVAVPLLAAPFGEPHPHSPGPSLSRTLTHPHPHSPAPSLSRILTHPHEDAPVARPNPNPTPPPLPTRAAGRVVRDRTHGRLPGPDVPDELRPPLPAEP